jgi:hypothetical protein
MEGPVKLLSLYWNIVYTNYTKCNISSINVKQLNPSFYYERKSITVNDVPKIHVRSPDKTHHAITFEETGFRIPLNLWGFEKSHNKSNSNLGVDA